MTILLFVIAVSLVVLTWPFWRTALAIAGVAALVLLGLGAIPLGIWGIWSLSQPWLDRLSAAEPFWGGFAVFIPMIATIAVFGSLPDRPQENLARLPGPEMKAETR